MIFKKIQPTINQKEIAENYLRNLPQSVYEQTLEIIEVYREADRKALEIEQKYQKYAEEELEMDFESIDMEAK